MSGRQRFSARYLGMGTDYDFYREHPVVKLDNVVSVDGSVCLAYVEMRAGKWLERLGPLVLGDTIMFDARYTTKKVGGIAWYPGCGMSRYEVERLTEDALLYPSKALKVEAGV